MTKDEVKYFLAGLKMVIKRSWPTQGEFAQGVTSKVNLSNILRGNSGTSKVMVKKLADRAGMSVDELVEMGKGTARTRKSDYSPVITQSVVPAIKVTPVMSSSELFSQTGDYSLQITENLMAHAKSVNTSIKGLVEDRERLQKLVEYQQHMINYLAHSVKVINPDKTIDYCNPYYPEHFNVATGSNCADTDCSWCQGECMVEYVFSEGKSVRKVIQEGGSWFVRIAHPIFSPTGKIMKVIVVTQPLDNILQLIKEAGAVDEEVA